VILAIETSCDDTAVALCSLKGEVLGEIRRSQLEHAVWGGVVPELASRAHLRVLPDLVEQVLKESKISWPAIQAIAVTQGPGLLGALLVGYSFAKGLAFSRKLPLLGIHHVAAHALSPLLDNPDAPLPACALVVSGGHSHTYSISNDYSLTPLGGTRDDAMGEAFDKVAKMLGLPYPGGPQIEKLAKGGDENAISFALPKIKGDPLALSFSGLKTATRFWLEENNHWLQTVDPHTPPKWARDLAASFQNSAVKQACRALARAAEKIHPVSLFLAGGVSANQRLRQAVQELGIDLGLPVAMPHFEHCTDNAAMVGFLGSLAFARKQFTPLTEEVFATVDRVSPFIRGSSN